MNAEVKKKNLAGRILSILGIVSLFVFVILTISVEGTNEGLFLVAGFVLLAVAVRRFTVLKGFSYSLWIFASVALAMYYPQHFLGMGDFKFSQLIVPLLQIIMFGMGSQMSLHDFSGVLKMPKAVIAGLVCQFTIMPIMGLMVVTVFNFPPEIAAGFILVGASPSGMASNVMSFLAKANLALSVTLTAFATLLSPLATPLLMKIFAEELVVIEFWNMVLGIFNMVILPICAGLIFNLFFKKQAGAKRTAVEFSSYVLIILLEGCLNYVFNGTSIQVLGVSLLQNLLFFCVLPIFAASLTRRFTDDSSRSFEKALSFISMLGIAIIIIVITASGRDSLLEVGLWLVAACMCQNLFGYLLGYFAAKALKLSEKDCRTIALEVGMQNGGLASGLAFQMGKVATVGLAPAIFGPLMNITGSSLAIWWRGKQPGAE